MSYPVSNRVLVAVLVAVLLVGEGVGASLPAGGGIQASGDWL